MSKRAICFPPGNAYATGMFDRYMHFPWTQGMINTLDDVMEDKLSQKVAEDPIDTWSLPQFSFPVIGLDVILNIEAAKQLYGLDFKNFDYAIGISLGEYIAGCLLGDLPLDKTLKMLSYLGESMNLVSGQPKWKLMTLNVD